MEMFKKKVNKKPVVESKKEDENKKEVVAVEVKPKTEIVYRIYESCDKCPPIMSGPNKGQSGHCPHCNDTRKELIAWVEKGD